MSKGKQLLDDYIKKGELCIVAGVKGVGKTMLLLNLAEEYRDTDNEKHILFYYTLKNGDLSTAESEGIELREISELPLQTGHILLEAGWTSKESGLSAIIIDDYRYLLRTEIFRNKDLSRTEKILFLLTRLKTIAEVYDVPVIISSDVDDDYIWGRRDKKSRLSDIPDREYAELIADKIVLLHRDEIFNKDSETPGIAELKICNLLQGMSSEHTLCFVSGERMFLRG
jgi:replicative DNA helicase